jgi:hypothetical protein
MECSGCAGLSGRLGTLEMLQPLARCRVVWPRLRAPLGEANRRFAIATPEAGFG